MEKKLQRLQRKLSRQQNLCPITTYSPDLGEHFNSCPINPHKGANKAKTQQQISRLYEKIRRARRAFNHKLATKLVQEYGGIATAKSELQKITRRPKPIVNKDGTGYEKNGAERKSQFNKLILANGLGQLTTLIEQKAAVNGREFIEIAPKDIPGEPRQRTEHYNKRLRLPRAVHLLSFFGRKYRAWSWESTLGESSMTQNQEATQVATLRDAGTTSKTSTKPPKERESEDVLQTSSKSASNQQQTILATPPKGKPARAISQNQPEVGSGLVNSGKREVSNQPKKAKRRSSAPLTAKTQSRRRKQRTVGENDSS